MIPRTLGPRLGELATSFPVVTLTGPRQSGKTTLCRATFPKLPYTSLEAPDVAAFAREDPRAFLDTRSEGAILDEIQHVPDLLSYIQPLVDREPRPGRFVLTGSQNLAISAAVSESLAGRTAVPYLLPLDRAEVRHTDKVNADLETTLLTGGYPAIYDRGLDPTDWVAAYVATYLERDLRQLHNVGDLSLFQTFLELCAGRAGTVVNLSALGGDAGVSHTTARTWLSVLEASFLTFRLRPWHRNLGKRLIKSPKLYFYDTAILCYLLGIREAAHLATHPLRGAIFENWVVAELAKRELHRGRAPRMWFYRDQRRLEVDVLVERAGELLAIEVKSAKTAVSDFFTPLRTFNELWPREEKPPRPIVLYGGDQWQRRSAGNVVPWMDVDAL